jgi:hypothetical protein
MWMDRSVPMSSTPPDMTTKTIMAGTGGRGVTGNETKGKLQVNNA